MIQHLPVRTEFLSEATEERLYDAWKQLQRPYQRKREFFNADVGEYYGQQALRLAGAEPVADVDRSDKVRRGVRKDPGRRPEPLPASQSTAGTDRLIENSVGLLSPDIDLSGDFRYMKDGYVTVGDYQTGNVEPTIRLNLLKAVEGPGTERNDIYRKYRQAEQQMVQLGQKPAPHDVILRMIDSGMIPPIKQARDGRGVRAGKSMSSHPRFESQNVEDQFRYDQILFGHTDKDRRSQPYGYIPEDLVLVDNAKALMSMGEGSKITVMGRPGERKEINVVPQIDDLIAAGAAERLSDRPLVRQLFA